MDHASFGRLSIDVSAGIWSTIDRYIGRYVDRYLVSTLHRDVRRESTEYRPIYRPNDVLLLVEHRPTNRPTVGRDSIGPSLVRLLVMVLAELGTLGSVFELSVQ